MNETEWLAVPVGPDAHRWVTRRSSRTVLVATHTLVSAQRLLDVVGLVEDDPRIQTVFTRAPDVFRQGVAEFLRDLGALEISWRQATQERFDLALATAYGGLAELHAPVVVLPHGAGYAKRTPAGPDSDSATREVYGLGPEQLVRAGRVVPTTIVLSHQHQRDQLARSCPAAVPATLVAGDPCYDRLRASLGRRAAYRDAIGVGPGRSLVLVASTWGPYSLFTRNPELLANLVKQLDPTRYRVAALCHPAVWFGHGRRQLRAWLHAEQAAGLHLVEPEHDWRALVVAADHLIGDHGSVTTYAAAIGVPVLQAGPPDGELDDQSAQALVAATAPRLRHDQPLAAQLRASANAMPPDWPATVAARLTSAPGQAHRLLREQLYRLLTLPMTGRHRAIEPVPAPHLEGARRHA